MLEYNHLQLVQMARHVYFQLIQEEGFVHPQLQQAHRQLLLAAERIYYAIIQVAEQCFCPLQQVDE